VTFVHARRASCTRCRRARSVPSQEADVVVGSQYRGAAGSEGKDEFGGADLNDVMNLLPLLEALPNADPSRIGMAGFSRGALMTYLALTKTDRIKAAVVAGYGGFQERCRAQDGTWLASARSRGLLSASAVTRLRSEQAKDR
jgi:dienelactone hydrolase